MLSSALRFASLNNKKRRFTGIGGNVNGNEPLRNAKSAVCLVPFSGTFDHFLGDTSDTSQWISWINQGRGSSMPLFFSGMDLNFQAPQLTRKCQAPSIIVLHVVLREQGIDLVNLLVIINIACNRRSQAKRDHRTGSIRKPIPIHFKQQAN